MTSPLILRFWCNEHEYVDCGFNTKITEVHFNQRGELGLACPICWKSRPMTIEVFTGREDIFNVKVFDGDIVKYEGFEKPAEVEWSDDLCQWMLTTRIYGGDGPDDYTLLGEPIDPDCDIEVIGNIHKNMEMLT